MCKYCCFQLQCYFTYTQKLTKNQTLHGKNNNKCHIKAVKASASQINNFYINIPILKTLPCRSIIKNTKICFFTCCGAEIFHEHTEYLINQASSQPDTKMCLCALRITSSYWITHQTKQLKKKQQYLPQTAKQATQKLTCQNLNISEYLTHALCMRFSFSNVCMSKPQNISNKQTKGKTDTVQSWFSLRKIPQDFHAIRPDCTNLSPTVNGKRITTDMIPLAESCHGLTQELRMLPSPITDACHVKNV